MNKDLDFSVILPVCHGGRFLCEALASVRKIDYPSDRFEVLVAGKLSDEETKTIVEQEARVVRYAVVYTGCTDAKRAVLLNTACSKASGSVLAFADDDCVFISDWLQKMRDVLLKGQDIGAVGGREASKQVGSSFDLALDSTLVSFFGTGGIRRGKGFRTGKYYPRLWNMAVPRSVAEKVALKTDGGETRIFNESLVVHEDVELMDRIQHAGKRIVFTPEMLIGHHRDTTLRSFIRRNFTMARTCRSLGIHRFPHTVLAIFALGALSLFAASFFYQQLWAILLICTGIYTMLLLAVSVSGLRKKRKLMVPIIIPALLISLHFARGLGYLLPLRKEKI